MNAARAHQGVSAGHRMLPCWASPATDRGPAPHFFPGAGGRSGRCHLQRLQQQPALRIDRVAHLESAWRRQEAAEEAARAAAAGPGVVELQNLAHLDAVVAAAGPGVVAVCFYSRTCGSCRKMMRRWDAMCSEAQHQRAGVRFLQHDVRTEYDDLSDVARLYRVRATPSFAFFVDGSKVAEVCMRDSRSMSGSSAAIRSSLAAAETRLGQALRGVLFRSAPSARR